MVLLPALPRDRDRDLADIVLHCPLTPCRPSVALARGLASLVQLATHDSVSWDRRVLRATSNPFVDEEMYLL